MTPTHYELPAPSEKRVVFLRGLPASGKSTVAKSTLAAHPAGTVARINNDDLIASVFGESFVDAGRLLAKMRETILRELLAHPAVRLILVDNTNLSEGAVSRLASIAIRAGAKTEVDDSFLDVPVEECIRRDALRPRPVGESVILGMSRKLP